MYRSTYVMPEVSHSYQHQLSPRSSIDEQYQVDEKSLWLLLLHSHGTDLNRIRLVLLYGKSYRAPNWVTIASTTTLISIAFLVSVKLHWIHGVSLVAFYIKCQHVLWFEEVLMKKRILFENKHTKIVAYRMRPSSNRDEQFWLASSDIAGHG